MNITMSFGEYVFVIRRILYDENMLIEYVVY